ncbi:hypothetical protein D3C86_1402340 [compost metagenome]
MRENKLPVNESPIAAILSEFFNVTSPLVYSPIYSRISSTYFFVATSFGSVGVSAYKEIALFGIKLIISVSFILLSFAGLETLNKGTAYTIAGDFKLPSDNVFVPMLAA